MSEGDDLRRSWKPPEPPDHLPFFRLVWRLLWVGALVSVTQAVARYFTE